MFHFDEKIMKRKKKKRQVTHLDVFSTKKMGISGELSIKIINYDIPIDFFKISFCLFLDLEEQHPPREINLHFGRIVTN